MHCRRIFGIICLGEQHSFCLFILLDSSVFDGLAAITLLKSSEISLKKEKLRHEMRLERVVEASETYHISVSEREGERDDLQHTSL